MHPIFPIDKQGNIKIKPIEHVRSPVKEPQTGGLADLETEIVLCGMIDSAVNSAYTFMVN